MKYSTSTLFTGIVHPYVWVILKTFWREKQHVQRPIRIATHTHMTCLMISKVLGIFNFFNRSLASNYQYPRSNQTCQRTIPSFDEKSSVETRFDYQSIQRPNVFCCDHASTLAGMASQTRSDCRIFGGFFPSSHDWLVVWNIWIIFPFSWECHHPNWRTPSFFRGVGQPPTSLPVPHGAQISIHSSVSSFSLLAKRRTQTSDQKRVIKGVYHKQIPFWF